MHDTLTFWSRGIRLYLALGAGLVTASAAAWAVVFAPTPVLATMYLEEVYAWLAVTLLAAAVIIGPLYKQLPRLAGRRIMFDARRLLGVDAAWFAALHATLAAFGVLKGANPFTLAPAYQQAYALGAIVLIILVLMAATSFDAAFRRLGPWWLRLHRLIYVAVLATLMHAFLIGAHAAGLLALITLAAAASMITLLHVRNAFIHHQATIWQTITICFMILLLLAVFNFGLGQHLGYSPLEALSGHYHHGS